MPRSLLTLDVVSGPVPYTVWALTVLCVIVLLVRRRPRRWLPRAVLGAAVGAIAGVVLVYVVDLTDAVGVVLPAAVAVWVGVAFAVVGLAIVNLWGTGWWRRVVAIITIVLALLSATLGVNAVFGINRTLGDMLGVATGEAIGGLPQPTASASPTGPLYATWNPPADMPAKGKVGLLTGADAIPSTAGFKPRDASIYLPPAALVKNAPALPFMVFMMGQPGNPDPSYIAEALDAMAAKNKGLAPIVIVADQLGAPGNDPVCADSQKFGGVQTYFNKDIVDYARAKLNILKDPAHWTIAGYSNGGACAFTWAAANPGIWGNLISISGDEFPGAEIQADTLATIFHGDQTAYDAFKPAGQLARNAGKFTGHLAVFTVGELDSAFTPGARRNADLARGAGFTTTFFVVPGADHLVPAIRGGLAEALPLLYTQLGLSR